MYKIVIHMLSVSFQNSTNSKWRLLMSTVPIDTRVHSQLDRMKSIVNHIHARNPIISSYIIKNGQSTC